MKKIEVNSSQINLENVKNSNYWDLISFIVWGHYKKEKYQDDSKISFRETWYGKADNHSGGSHGSHWNNPNHKEKGYTRHLKNIIITFERSDFTTKIVLYVETGSIHCYGLKNNTDPLETVRLNNYNYLPVCNWMIENNFYKIK